MNGWVLYATIWFIVWVVCLHTFPTPLPRSS